VCYLLSVYTPDALWGTCIVSVRLCYLKNRRDWCTENAVAVYMSLFKVRMLTGLPGAWLIRGFIYNLLHRKLIQGKRDGCDVQNA
jgi:hypothetical protein